MVNMVLSGQAIDNINDPSWETVEVALLGLHPEANAFICLEIKGRGFVQTAGKRDCLVIEWADQTGPDQRQFRLNRKGAAEAGIDQSCTLDLTDALHVFERFYMDGDIPPYYALIDITDEIGLQRQRDTFIDGLLKKWKK